MKLLLWDIDGTLICNGLAGERAFDRAMAEIHGIQTSIRVVDYRGRTDIMITRMLLEHHGIPVTETAIHDLLEGYLQRLSEELKTGTGGPHPGVLEILNEARDRKDVAQGLLTGNMQRGAKLKLSHYDVWGYFEFGAFSDDSHIRDELGPFALRRASEHQGSEFSVEKTFVIGDTPHGVACGKAIGAHTIAVATGAYSLDELKACNPSAAFADFSKHKDFFGIIDTLAGSKPVG